MCEKPVLCNTVYHQKNACYVYTARQVVRKNNGSGSKCHVQGQPMILAGSITRELVRYRVF